MSNKVGTGFISFHTVNDGESAELLYLSATSSIMTFDSDNKPSPSSQKILLVAKVQNANGTAAFSAKAYNGDTEIGSVLLAGLGNQRTITEADWPSEATHIVVTASLPGLTDVVTLVKVKDGARGVAGKDVIAGYLTNESITLTAKFDGTVLNFDKATGTFRVFEGLADKTADAVVYSVSTSTGATGTINSTTGVYKITAMSQDTATIDFKAIYKGVEIVKTLSLSKSKQGESGIDTVVMVLGNESHTVIADHEGTVLSFEGAETDIYVYEGIDDITNSVVLSAAPTEGISGTLVGNRYTVTAMTEETGFVNIKATIAGQEFSKRFSIAKSRNGYTPVKDIDYFDGEDTYSVEVVSTEGNIFRNGVIYARLNAIVKKGSEDITDLVPANKFVWQRTSKKPAEDESWNLSHSLGSKSIEITDDDIFQKAIFTCTVLK